MFVRRRAPTSLLASLGLAASVALIVPALTASASFTASTFPGLGSGRVWSVAVSPNSSSVLLAATDGGVYRSANAGASWSLSSLRGVRAWVVGFDARSPHVAFAGLDGQGVARSSDGGATWTDSSSGLTDMTVRSLAFGLEGLAAGTHSGVDVSTDGIHWRTAGLDGYNVSSVVVSANQPQLTLIAGVDGTPANAPSGRFLFRNKGGALQWEALQQGLPASTFVSSVAVGPLPAAGQRPLLVTTTKGVYHSGDGGTTWTSSTGIPDTLTLTTSAFSPIDPNLVYAGADAGGSSGGALMRSTDSGASFTSVADALPDGRRNVDAIAVSAATPPTVYVGVNPPSSTAAVYRGPDAGAPTPGSVATDSAGAALASVAPTPQPTATATPRPQLLTAPPESTGLRHLVEVAVRFPFPLMLELLFIVLIVYLVLRWRQRYLDVEGPP